MGKIAVVIVAAGRGERLGNDRGPKQYRQLHDRSVLQHTLDCFSSNKLIDLIQVVIHPDDYSLYLDAVVNDEKVLAPVEGGATRQSSCMAGLEGLKAHGVEKVLIHDAARPFVSDRLIEKTLSGVKWGICALPAVAVADTVKRANEELVVIDTIPRSSLFLAQTPQGFMFDEILNAHREAAHAGQDQFTDDAAVAEWVGMTVKIVDGDRENLKITTKQDFESAMEKVRSSNNFTDIRVGSGYDVHSLVSGRGVILCGVEIPFHLSLQGHSDADVGLHALTDALLGTIGDGDIGSHFPPSDPVWKGASSDQFLNHAVALVKKNGGTITNLDVTLICEAPKIGPHRDKMRESISHICELDMVRVSVKATTNEKIGFIGRQEGIAALATATVSFSGVSHV